MKKFYEILEISETASQEEIKKAYLKLAAKHHPDRNATNKEVAEAKFKEINVAYEILSDPKKREQYDRTGSSDGFGADTGGGRRYSGAGMEFEQVFADLFGGADIFGSRAARKTKRTSFAAKNGHDVEIALTITFKESYTGAKQKVEYSRFVVCEHCQGTCSEKDEKPIECQQCKGYGAVDVASGWASISYDCNVCQGQGLRIKNPCAPCRGSGRVRKQEELEISVPAGVETGNILRIEKKGDAGVYKGQYGNLLVAINIQKDKIFSRRDYDLESTLKVPYPHLVLGCEIMVKLIDDSEELLKIPAGCQIGERIVIKQKGFQKIGSKMRGNFVITVTCDIPKKLSDQGVSRLREYAAVIEVEEKKSEGFLSGLFKKFF